MDELELLKKHWKHQEADFPRVSANEIYKMILKRSSSIVKWIFIISLMEFAFWSVISFILNDTEGTQQFNQLNADYLMVPLTVFGYVVLAYFFFLFYRNYRKISITDNAKQLMENILKTRRTVKNYVIFNLAYMALAFIAALYIEFNQNKDLIDNAQNAANNGEAFIFYASFILIFLVVFVVLTGILLVFYWLIYGLLLRKLNKNYKELKKLEM